MLLIVCGFSLAQLTACQQAATPTPTLPAQSNAPMIPYVPGETQPSADSTQAATVGSPAVTLDLSSIAQDQLIESIPAVSQSDNSPWFGAMPAYTQITIQGYPATINLMQPQIFSFPVAELAKYNETAAQMATDLQSLLQSRQIPDRLPFLPLQNAAQTMHAQVQFIDFKNGSGVRFLTQFDQAVTPINNSELIYSFQGLTRDAKYYVVAILPVTQIDLPADMQVSNEQATEIADFPAYLTEKVTWLDAQPSGSFTPDLTGLDMLIQSIEIK